MASSGEQFEAALPDEPIVVYRLDAAIYPPYGGWIVWSPLGTGRLRTVSSARKAVDGEIPDRNPAYFEQFLLLNESPLVRWLSNGCDTCEQILAPIARSPRQLTEWTNAINGIARETIVSDQSGWIDAFMPLISLLSPGFWLLTADEYFPTDGAGRLFWSADSQSNECRSLSHHCDTPNVPIYLVGTQSVTCFDSSRFTAAREKFRSHPGIAIHLGGRLSALLDGHHRAVAAASEGATFMCVTISHARVTCDLSHGKRIPQFWLDQSTKVRLRSLPAKSVAWASRTNGPDDSPPRFSLHLSDAQVDNILRQHAPPIAATSIPINFPDLNADYPTDVAMDSVFRVAGGQGRLSDATIEQIVNLLPLSRGYEERCLEDLLVALETLKDERLIPVAARVARDGAWSIRWNDVYRILARHRSAEVDDLFVEFLVNDDGTYPDIKQTIDDYFRQPAQSDTASLGEPTP